MLGHPQPGLVLQEVPAHPAPSPLQPWFCCSWCGWSAGRRSDTPSSCSSTPRTMSGTTSSSMTRREVERRIRWGQPMSCGQGAAVQSICALKKVETTLFAVKHMQRVVFLYLWWGSFIGFSGVVESQQVQKIQDIYYWDTLLCKQDHARRPVPHRFFYPLGSFLGKAYKSLHWHCVQTVFLLFKSLKLCILPEIFIKPASSYCPAQPSGCRLLPWLAWALSSCGLCLHLLNHL